MIRLLLVDDHSSFRQPLAFMLDREPDMRVVGQAGAVSEARPLLGLADVALFDLDLPDGTGLDLIRELRAINQCCAALVLTASAARRDFATVVEAGASGVMHKSVRIEEIISAVRRLHQGEALMSARETAEMLQLAGEWRAEDSEVRAALSRLTAREREVLQALADGLGDKEIAARLVLSVDTARRHMANILGKLGADSRLQALVLAVRHGAVEIR